MESKVQVVGSDVRTSDSLPDSVAMQVCFGDQNQENYLKISICFALYIALAVIWLPGFQIGGGIAVLDDEEAPVVRRKVLRPPPEKPLQKVVTRERKSRKVPMPDLTPDDPEPAVLAEIPEAPDVVATDDWEIGIPDAPPTREVVAMVGSPGVEAPVFTRRVQPDYPQKGVEVRLQGYVVLQAVLGKDGSVLDVEVLRGLGRGKFGFEEAAIDSLRKWQFIPGRVNGQPADVRMNLRVDFILN